MNEAWLLKGGTIYTGKENGFIGDILFSECIQEVRKNITEYPENTHVIDCSGKIVRPGGIDIHTHFALAISDTVQTAEGFSDGTRGALAGGITTIGDFATQAQGEELKSCYLARKALMEEQAHCKFLIHLGITDWQDDSFEIIRDLQKNNGLTSIKLFTTYKERNYDSNQGELFRALKQSRQDGFVVMVHSEDDELIADLKKRCENDPVMTELEKFCAIRPSMSESLAVNNLCYLNSLAGGNLYVVHISAGDSIRMIHEYRLKYPNAHFFAETCPQYLAFDDSVFQRDDGCLFASCPQIKSAHDRKQLLSYLNQYAFDTIGTDNCSFLTEQKLQGLVTGFSTMPVGMAGTQFLLPITYDLMVKENDLSPENWVYHTAVRQTEIFQIKNTGLLQNGYASDIVIFDPDRKWSVQPQDIVSNADWSPYLNREFSGKVTATFLDGKLEFQLD